MRSFSPIIIVPSQRIAFSRKNGLRKKLPLFLAHNEHMVEGVCASDQAFLSSCGLLSSLSPDTRPRVDSLNSLSVRPKALPSSGSLDGPKSSSSTMTIRRSPPIPMFPKGNAINSFAPGDRSLHYTSLSPENKPLPPYITRQIQVNGRYPNTDRILSHCHFVNASVSLLLCQAIVSTLESIGDTEGDSYPRKRAISSARTA